jgi:hypothetical protein
MVVQHFGGNIVLLVSTYVALGILCNQGVDQPLTPRMLWFDRLKSLA